MESFSQAIFVKDVFVPPSPTKKIILERYSSFEVLKKRPISPLKYQNFLNNFQNFCNLFQKSMYNKTHWRCPWYNSSRNPRINRTKADKLFEIYHKIKVPERKKTKPIFFATGFPKKFSQRFDSFGGQIQGN